MCKILIVEDEKPISELIRINLTNAGHDCTCVYDGKAAADLLENTRFDLVLLDVMLPNVDGFELMDYIRPMDIPVIFLTAKGNVDDRVKGLRLGAEDYIVKPFAIAELLARVDTVIRRYSKADSVIEFGAVEVLTQSHLVMRRGVAVELTQRNMSCFCCSCRTKTLHSLGM